MRCTKGFAERLSRPPAKELSWKVTVKQYRLFGVAEEPHSLLCCLCDPAEVSCLFSWPKSWDIYFLYLDTSLGHEHAEIDVRYFTETMRIATGGNWKGNPTFSKEPTESWNWVTNRQAKQLTVCTGSSARKYRSCARNNPCDQYWDKIMCDMHNTRSLLNLYLPGMWQEPVFPLPEAKTTLC